MEKMKFLNELKDILELEDDNINEESEIHLTSLSTLSLMAFIYENFEIQAKASDLHKITHVGDIMNLIGKDRIV